ncbi:MAG: hypothetical protein ACTSRU_06535 [Candidatus Hodarchaeales archaeon]
MYEDRALKALLGNSLNMPEEDMDDLRVMSQTGYPYEEAALKSYYFLTILDSIRTGEFQESFNATIPLLRAEYGFKDLQELCNEILRYIKERYDFIFPEKVKVKDLGDTSDVISLIKFLEYDNEEFIVNVWKYLKPETNSFQFQNYCEQNGNKIISEIEEQSDTRSYPKLIADFLRTYNKDDMIEWFCEQSERLNTAILLGIREGEENV